MVQYHFWRKLFLFRDPFCSGDARGPAGSGFSVFRLESPGSAKGPPTPKWPKKAVLCDPPPPKCPLAPGNCIFLFSAQKAALGQNGLRNQYVAVPHPWQSGRPKDKTLKKVAEFRGEIFWAAGFPPIKVPLAPGNCGFVFTARARNFSPCQRPEMGQTPTDSLFP